MSLRGDAVSALPCLVVEVSCASCRARLRRQTMHDALDALIARPRCPECDGRVDVVRILGHAARETDWERVREPEDAPSWMVQRDLGMRHCE